MMNLLKRLKIVIGTALILSCCGSATLALQQQTRSSQSALHKPEDLLQVLGLDKHPQLIKNRHFKKSFWHFKQRAFPLGYIPANAIPLAIKQLEQLQSQQTQAGWSDDVAAKWIDKRLKTALSPMIAMMITPSWTNIGPAPITGGQIGATLPARNVSGRVTSIAVDPGNSNHWLIGAAQGGIWETKDAGTTWAARTDSQTSLAMGAIAFAASNPQVVYAGTGEANSAVDSYGGQGVLKSFNGGTSWKLLPNASFATNAVSRIQVNPINYNNVLAATTYGFAGRGSDQAPTSPTPGIYISTNGGLNWSLKLTGQATDLKVDPTNFNNQYAAIGDTSGNAANGIYRSTDGGNTWTVVTGPWSGGNVGRIALAIAPSNPSVMYVSIQNTSPFGQLLGLWVTSNAFATTPTWTQINTKPTDDGSGVYGYCGWDKAFNSASNQCWYNHELIVDPANSNTLYAGGTPLWKYDGTNWTEVSNQVSSPTNGIHADQHSMAFAGTRLIVGNDGGVWSSTDGGANWNDNNTNLSITQFYYGSITPANSNLTVGGAQDNGTAKFSSSAWQDIAGGDGGDNAISFSNANNMAVSFDSLQILRIISGATTPQYIGIDRTNAPFIAAFAKSPNNDDVFIAGTDQLWKSTDFFSSSPSNATWTSNNSPSLGGPQITAVAFAASDTTSNTYAFGSGTGQIYLTTDGGTSYTNLSTVPGRYVTALAFDPTNANTLYVTLSGFDQGTPSNPGHVFKTTNALSGSPTWTNITPSVNIPYNSIAVDTSNNLFVGTDLGVWESTNGGTNWSYLGPSTGMPYVAVFDLRIDSTNRKVFAYTHGRGAFTSNY